MATFALVDCNNFYASCERVFAPALNGKAVIVLSNNDGCAIARSNEAKALGIKMGAPWHQIKALCDHHQVAVFSSNYALYGDMSQRVMRCLEEFTPDLEMYSIDEAFLKLDGFEHVDLEDYASKIRQTIDQWTGLPVCVGLGPTKTLAKIANYIAKKRTKKGTYDLSDRIRQTAVLPTIDVSDIWGIGHRWAARLKSMGITNALELRDAEPKIIRQQFSVVAERIVYELRGIACLDLEQPQPKQTIACSRSFGQPVYTNADLKEAVSFHAVTAARKLRAQRSKAAAISTFIATNRFQEKQPQYSASTVHYFEIPTSDDRQLISVARRSIDALYREGFQYKKAGILFLELIPAELEQGHLFAPSIADKSDELMEVVDRLNERWGKSSLFFASQGIRQSWKTQAKWRSPRYTTAWNELAVSRC